MSNRSRRGRQVEKRIQEATERQEEMLEGESSHPQVEVNMEEQIFTRISERLATEIVSVQFDPEKKYGIERLKALGATTFEVPQVPQM